MLLTENYEPVGLFPTHTSFKASVELICAGIVVLLEEKALSCIGGTTAISSCNFLHLVFLSRAHVCARQLSFQLLTSS